MIAEYGCITLYQALLYARDDTLRIRPVAHQVAKKYMARCAVGSRMRKYCVERFNIAVDIGDQCVLRHCREVPFKKCKMKMARKACGPSVSSECLPDARAGAPDYVW